MNRPTRVQQKLDRRRTNQGRNDGNVIACNVATTMALQLATLLLLRFCYCWCDVATVATLLLERATALLLQRCCCSALLRCCCNVVVARYGAAAATTLLLLCVVVPLRLKFLFFFYSTTLGEKMRVRKKKRNEIRNLFPYSIG
jgi:hypothetical protein